MMSLETFPFPLEKKQYLIVLLPVFMVVVPPIKMSLAFVYGEIVEMKVFTVVEDVTTVVIVIGMGITGVAIK